jgi:hypothetical protein
MTMYKPQLTTHPPKQGTNCARSLYQDMFRSFLPFGSGADDTIGTAVENIPLSAISEPESDMSSSGSGGGVVAWANAAAPQPLPVDMFSEGDASFLSSTTDSLQPNVDPDDMTFGADIFPPATTYEDEPAQVLGAVQGNGLVGDDDFVEDVWPIDA